MIVRQYFILFAIISPILVLLAGLLWPPMWFLFAVLIPVILLGLQDIQQTHHTIRRNYPVLGRFRYMLEAVRPELQQYFVESDTNGKPISREYRSLIYQRAKGDRDTRPFGTIFDVNEAGYEWLNHSLNAHISTDEAPCVKFGGAACSQPYMASPLNISAMSFGSLSQNAIMALNKGAKIGGFYHNTGEGGLSPHHLKHGGDIVWQIGTGYFGCRNGDGGFDEELFRSTANLPVVKMIEIKLSQGAKPGHGGILPASKLTPEIAAIRHVDLGQDVISPPVHQTFSTPEGLLHFVQRLRDLSNGKPVGIKLCIGHKVEFLALCKAMLSTDITPDFITVDGSEGGTGAAPLEMTNSVGMPLRDALVFVNRALIGCQLRERMNIIASGKLFSAFHMLRALALGADTVNSARGMMLALGCVQARSCNTDHCPTGIATQNPARSKGLVVEDKAQRVANFHHETIKNLMELMAAAGLKHLHQLQPHHINRRVQGTDIQTYAELYPSIDTGCLLDAATLPEEWRKDWQQASAQQW